MTFWFTQIFVTHTANQLLIDAAQTLFQSLRLRLFPLSPFHHLRTPTANKHSVPQAALVASFTTVHPSLLNYCEIVHTLLQKGQKTVIQGNQSSKVKEQ